MKLTNSELPGVLIIEPDVFHDDRGFFMELWNADRYAGLGWPPFVQDNLSSSRRGVIRGLHLQHPTGQAKLVSVLDGEIFDVAVDVRRGSATFGRWVGVTLSAANRRQLAIPAGFAHGFAVTSDSALVAYKCTAPYAREHELTIRWNDPVIGISWPVAAPSLSPKDADAPSLAAIPPERLPVA
jgi:dTDP-4-dehydrorhamnose 3,5-epimerase